MSDWPSGPPPRIRHAEPDNTRSYIDQKAEREGRRAAANFKHDDALERLISWRNSADPTDRARYERLSPAQKMAIGYYEANKLAAEQYGDDAA
jgi:hypothetical protein